MITSRLNSTSQITIPEAVRKALDLREGDELVYVIEDGVVVMTRLQQALPDDPFVTFTEWHSDADHKAYDKL